MLLQRAGRSAWDPRRALTDGPVALSQEPRVHYVALTRATHNLYLLADADGTEDQDLETVLFEL